MRPRVLVLHEDVVVVTGLCRMLLQKGYDVRFARGEESALSLVRLFAPEIVVADLSGPKGAGTRARLYELNPDLRDVQIENANCLPKAGPFFEPTEVRAMVNLLEQLVLDPGETS